jgi:hypothetical protein
LVISTAFHTSWWSFYLLSLVMMAQWYAFSSGSKAQACIMVQPPACENYVPCVRRKKTGKGGKGNPKEN